jgi:uncharacterized membrane protein (GlpM family)
MKAKNIIQGVVLVYAFTFIGGFVIGVTVGNSDLPPQQVVLALMVSNFIFSIVGFCITGILVKTERFKTLLVVALICWLLSALNMLFVPTFGPLQWVFSSVFLLVTMGIGGGLSYLFAPAVPNQNELEAEPPPPPDFA